MHLTKYQAISHLKGVIKLCSDKNRYLSCVRNYLKDVKIDILSEVRADQFDSYEDVQSLNEFIMKAETAVEVFLSGEFNE